MTSIRDDDLQWTEVKRRNRKSVFDQLGSKYKSNQDQMETVTTSIYVANFPSHLTVKELVSNVTILVQDLCKIRIGKLRLHANVPKHPRKAVTRLTGGENVKPHQFNSAPGGKAKYVSVLKNEPVALDDNGETKVQPSISIDYVPIENAYPFAVVGCYKDFRAIANIRCMCHGEGFIDIKPVYLGGLWVMIDFPNIISPDAFLVHNAVSLWFSELRPWHNDFIVKERIVWLEAEGIPLLAWGDETVKSIAGKWGELLFVDNSDDTNRFNISAWTPNFIAGFKDDEDNADGDSAGSTERSDSSSNLGEPWVEKEEHLVEQEVQEFEQEVPPGFNFHENHHAEKDKQHDMGGDSDPFHLASLIAKTTTNKKDRKEEKTTDNYPHNIESNFGSLKFPPGFTPSRTSEASIGATNERQGASVEVMKDDSPLLQESSPTNSYSLDKSKFLHQSCSVIEKLDSVIAVGQALGWNMNGCVKTLERIINENGATTGFQ
ncbi:hypothetical protein LXL04_005661 [Taraxacum kok-saghyz]